MYRFQVGAIECVSLNDGDLLLPPEVIFPVSRRAEWPPVSLDDQGRMAIAINCLLVKSGEQIVLVDTGNGTKSSNAWAGGGRLLSELAAAGVKPSEIDVVVVTHAHGDHIGGLTSVREGQLKLSFPRARYVVPRADWDYFTAPERVKQMAFVRESLLPLAETGRLDLLEGEVNVTPDMRLLPAPGHTPGLSVVVVSSQGQMLLQMGDLFHHRVQIEDPGLVRDLDLLPDMVPVSRQKVIQLALERSAQVFAAHQSSPGLGTLAREGERVVFRPTGG